MLRLKFCVLIALLFFSCKLAYGQDEVCEDLFFWCSTRSEFCDDIAIQTICPSTCSSCPATECLSANCDQRCTAPTTQGNPATCSCFDGYELQGQTTCVDINECLSGNPCDDDPCVNTQGDFFCSRCNRLSEGSIGSYYGNRSACCAINSESTCGQSSLNQNILDRPRIVGGVQTRQERWPWMARLYVENADSTCGGSLITTRWVLTAAHCVDTANTDTIVLLGASNVLDVANQRAQVFSAEEVIIHENYDASVSESANDIALIRLNGEAEITPFVNTICLPNGEVPLDNQLCHATGFGLTSQDSDQVEDVLREVDLAIISDTVCSNLLEGTGFDAANQLCAGFIEGGRDTCQGDSGGPLVCQRCNSCDFYQIGIVSFGVGCAREGLPGVYIDVNEYQDWIVERTGQPSSSEPCTPPEWGSWGDFSECSVTCGGGTQERQRVCMGGDPGDPGCPGLDVEQRPCNEAICEEWGSWGDFSECSVTCGGGTQERQRVCMGGDPGDPGCPGLDVEQRPCNEAICEAWGPWSMWSDSDCSVTCGGGEQTRTRMCENGEVGDPGCIGPTMETQVCNPQPCSETGTWGEWTGYGSCSVSCGSGLQSRTRQCLDGPGNCDGSTAENQVCSGPPCPCDELENLYPNCCNLINAQYCQIEPNGCDLACCQLTSAQPCRDPSTCKDSFGLVCSVYTPEQCNTVAILRTLCPFTCNNCP